MNESLKKMIAQKNYLYLRLLGAPKGDPITKELQRKFDILCYKLQDRGINPYKSSNNKVLGIDFNTGKITAIDK